MYLHAYKRKNHESIFVHERSQQKKSRKQRCVSHVYPGKGSTCARTSFLCQRNPYIPYKDITYLCRNIRFKENPYSGIFYDHHHHHYLPFLTLHKFTVLDFLSKDLTSASFLVQMRKLDCMVS